MTEQQNLDQTSTDQRQSDKEYNFAQLRKQLESSERERQAALQKAEQLEREMQSSRSRPQDSYEDDDDGEPYVDSKKLKKTLNKFEERFLSTMEEKVEAKARVLLEKEKQTAFLKQNPDFLQILQPEMLQKFAEKYPDIAENMLEMPDNFSRQKLLYQNIKAVGLHKKEEPKQSIQETIEKNRRSPYYQPSGVGTAPYANGGDFSEGGQKSAYEKIQQLKKNLRI